MKLSFSAAAFFLAASLTAAGANLTSSEKIVKEIPLDLGGSFWITAAAGNIEVVGAEVPNVQMTAVKNLIADSPAALEDAREQTQISIEGDQAVRLVRTIVPGTRSPHWSSSITYTLRVPRYCHVKISSKSAERIRVANIVANVSVKSFNGMVILDGVTGASTVDATNSSILYNYTAKPISHATMTTLNGDVEVRVPAESNFDWVADTLRGDFLTTLPVRGSFSGTTLRGTVNSPGGPTITTNSLLGKIAMLQQGTRINQARRLQSEMVRNTPRPSQQNGPSAEATLRIPIVSTNFATSLNIGNVEIGEIKGEARIDTRAGQVQIDRVWGACTVISLGGPLILGDVMGRVYARTNAGDVFVRSAREGGTMSTGGGNVRVLFTGGPTSLKSEGGDLVVRQATAAIDAETRSGDITITTDPNAKTLKLDAHTTFGNIILNLQPRFGADIDATVITSDADANAIHSDFGGLTIRREQVGNKTRIHATGKINGGGEKVTLTAEEGDIHISAQTSATISLVP